MIILWSLSSPKPPAHWADLRFTAGCSRKRSPTSKSKTRSLCWAAATTLPSASGVKFSSGITCGREATKKTEGFCRCFRTLVYGGEDSLEVWQLVTGNPCVFVNQISTNGLCQAGQANQKELQSLHSVPRSEAWSTARSRGRSLHWEVAGIGTATGWAGREIPRFGRALCRGQCCQKRFGPKMRPARGGKCTAGRELAGGLRLKFSGSGGNNRPPTESKSCHLVLLFEVLDHRQFQRAVLVVVILFITSHIFSHNCHEPWG